MAQKIKIVLAQLNFIVGDIQGNLKKHLKAMYTAYHQYKADLIIFPELSLTGYPPEDLLLRKSFIEETNKILNFFINQVPDIYCVVGHPMAITNGLQNTCSIIYQGKIVGQYAKQSLPNYGVFDEKRYFIPGNAPCVISIHQIPIGLVICEDLWDLAPTEQAVKAGARLIISPNASPFEINKHEQRIKILSTRTSQIHVPIIYVNQIGGQDSLIFDGGSMLINEAGNISHFAGFFNEILLPIDFTTDYRVNNSINDVILPNTEERIYQGLVLALQDYINKNRFSGVIIGLSGGIDSALTLCIAVDALGKERVHTVMLPSRHTSEISLIEAKKIAKNLDVQYDVISIEPSYQAFLNTLAPLFINKKIDTTEENIQARCRAIILMALSNKSGYLVLSTGNRSEMAVGYNTLYGDLAGGFAILKNIPKTLVYQLANYRNSISSVIPSDTLTRAPSAELAPDQKDEDALTSYAVLDKILDGYIKQNLSVKEIIAQGFDEKIVKKIIHLIQKNEYKRCQAPIGPHINLHSFGKDWRYPITNGFVDDEKEIHEKEIQE